MTRSMTEALNAPILFREKVKAVRGRLDKRQVSPAGAMLEVGVAYLSFEQTLDWALSKAAGDERAVALLRKTQAKLQQLARAMATVPELG